MENDLGQDAKPEQRPRRSISQGTLALIVICVVAVISGILMGIYNPLFPDAVSREGRLVDKVFDIILGISTVIFVIVVATLVYVVFYYGRTRVMNSPIENDENRFLHLAWTIIPIAINAPAKPIPAAIFFSSDTSLYISYGVMS